MKANKHLRIKIGTKRADGKVFCGYKISCANGEKWSSQAQLETNREKGRGASLEFRKDGGYKKAHAEYGRARYAAREDVRVYRRNTTNAWNKRFPDRVNRMTAKRRAIKASQLHPMHDRATELRMHAEANALSGATGIRHEVDHIIPLAHGGWHHHLNLQVLPISVNRKKQANPFWISDTYKDFRSVPQELWPEALVDFYLAMLSV